MIGYICKYTPVEIFESLSFETQRIEPEVASFNQADTLMHPNICSFAKGVLEDVLTNQYEGIVLTTCCDSIRRLYDVLVKKLPDTFIYILDIPRITKDGGIKLYEQRIREMVLAFEKFSGKTFDENKLAEILKASAEKEAKKNSEGQTRIGILGARANKNIHKILEDKGAAVAFDITCTGLDRKLLYEADDVFTGYVRGLLSQFPCMRMETAANRDLLIQKYADSADGIIYHTVQFCDSYSYEYAWLKEIIQKPLLLLETDNTTQSYGQILTRLEAFLESVQKSGSERRQRAQEKIKTFKGDQTMYVMGIDSGSTSTNAVIMDNEKNIKAFSVIRTGAKSGESAERILSDILEKAQLKKEDIAWIVSTGYGRVSIPFADENVTEISCHGRGAHYFNPKIRTILDIGGQDSKAIKLDAQGEVIDFVMNDKCAAGTGRFLEAIARTLEISIDELGPAALKSTEDIEITSMCTVFAESEVISLIANNKEESDIANGICQAIANKSYSLLKRVGLEPDYMMTGGVAKNPGVVRAVEEKLQASLYICPEPEIVGAVGAALYALDTLK
jgi:predicted CoA-substrate-specific enzyme activase